MAAAETQENISRVAIYGGTFDPIHFGHLRSAIEVASSLALDQLRLIPAFIPPHRAMPTTSALQRLDMLNTAIAGQTQLKIDARELERKGLSFTIDTLSEIREEIGEAASLSMVMGMDAFALLPTWHRWAELTDLAHLVILTRPGFEASGTKESEVATILSDWAASKWTQDIAQLQNSAAGKLHKLGLTQLEISATQIRQLIFDEKSVDYLLPKGVIEYIRSNKLYQAL